MMKLGEVVVVHMDNYNFTKFHKNQMKNNKKSFINSLKSMFFFKKKFFTPLPGCSVKKNSKTLILALGKEGGFP